MAEPALVADCIKAMQDAVDVPVTVKCRIGIDAFDSQEYLDAFIAAVAATGCRSFIIHARIALLQGLSPKENREIPPLNYPRVHRLKQQHPELEITINGGIRTLDECREQLAHVDGVMLGREAYHNPWLLHEVDTVLFGAAPRTDSRFDVIEAFYPYAEDQLQRGALLHHLTRHVLGLFQGVPGGKRFRRHLSENAHRKGAGLEVLRAAVALVADCPALEETA